MPAPRAVSAARSSWRSSSSCSQQRKSISSGCAAANSRTSAERGSRSSTGQCRQSGLAQLGLQHFEGREVDELAFAAPRRPAGSRELSPTTTRGAARAAPAAWPRRARRGRARRRERKRASGSCAATARARRAVREAGHGLEVDVHRVAEDARDRAVGRDPVAAVQERVQRVQRDEVDPELAQRVGHAGEIGEVAEARVGATPHGVEVRPDAERAARAERLVRAVRRGRRDDQELLRAAAGEEKPELSERRARAATGSASSLQASPSPAGRVSSLRAPASVELGRHGRRRRGRAHAQDRRALGQRAEHLHGRDDLRRRFCVELGEPLARLRLARAGEAHRGAQRLASRVRGRAVRALDVVVAAEHAESLGERGESRARRVAHACRRGSAPSQRQACGAIRTRAPRTRGRSQADESSARQCVPPGGAGSVKRPLFAPAFTIRSAPSMRTPSSAARGVLPVLGRKRRAVRAGAS